MGFQSEPEKSISSHEGFYQDGSDEGNTTERDPFERKIATLVLGESVELLHNENKKGMSLRSRSEGCLRFESSEYICSELNNNFIELTDNFRTPGSRKHLWWSLVLI